MKILKIYLAGADVFRKNADEYFKTLKLLCEKYSFEGISPIDNEEFDGELNSEEHSKFIFKHNIYKIIESNIIVANLLPFRGACVDDGTSSEIGFGFARNKLIYGYTPFYDKNIEHVTNKCFNIKKQSEFPLIENFNNGHVNLMIQNMIYNSGGKILENFEDCLKNIRDNI